MTQANLDTPAIDPATTTGTDLAFMLSNWRTALHSSHSGSSTPSYVAAGMLWYDSTLDILKLHDGAGDIPTFVVDEAGDRAFPFTQNPRYDFPVTGGSANAQTLTLTPALASYVDMGVFTFEASASNTGAATLNVNGVGAKAVRKINGGTDVALDAGDIQQGVRYTVQYDSAANGAAGGFIITGEVGGQTGTFTPALSFGGNAVGLTYAARGGSYTKLGNLVFFDISMTLTARGSSTGNAAISGLPFTAASSSAVYFGSWSDMQSLTGSPFGRVNSGDTTMSLRMGGAATAHTVLQQTNFNSSAAIAMSGYYRV